MTKGNEEMKNLVVGANDLIEATKAGNFTKVKYLMNKHPELIGNKDDEGRTALMWAAYRGFSKIVKKLVDNGIEVGMQDNQGRNALAYALSRGDVDNFSRKDEKNGKRYDSNLAVGVIQCVNPVNGYGAMDICSAILFNETNEAESPDINGITPLMRLSAMHCPDLLSKLDSEKLKQLKCDQAFTKDKNDKTALDYATEQTKKVAGESNKLDLKKGGKFARDFPQYKQLLANQKAEEEAKKAEEKTKKAAEKAEKKRQKQEAKAEKKRQKQEAKWLTEAENETEQKLITKKRNGKSYQSI